MRISIVLLGTLLTIGCANRRAPVVAPTGNGSEAMLEPCSIADANHDCLDSNGKRLGTEGWECPTENTADCFRARNYETPDGRAILTPVGCALKKIGLLWLLGDRTSVCEKKEKKR